MMKKNYNETIIDVNNDILDAVRSLTDDIYKLVMSEKGGKIKQEIKNEKHGINRRIRIIVD